MLVIQHLDKATAIQLLDKVTAIQQLILILHIISKKYRHLQTQVA